MSMYYAVLVATREPPPRRRRRSLAMVLVALVGAPLGTLLTGPAGPSPDAAHDAPPRPGQAAK